MKKHKRKTSATPANVSRSSRCKTTRRQRLVQRFITNFVDGIDLCERLTKIAKEQGFEVLSAQTESTL